MKKIKLNIMWLWVLNLLMLIFSIIKYIVENNHISVFWSFISLSYVCVILIQELDLMKIKSEYETMNKPKPLFNIGYIRDFNDETIYCLFKREYQLDLELVMSRNDLTKKQNKMVCLGLVVRYDTVNHKIEFMNEDEEFV